MNRDLAKLTLLLGAMLLGALAIFGCQFGNNTDTDASWTQADSHAEDIGQKVTNAATQVSGSAGEIVTAARDGHAATPEAIRPTLDPFWIRIVANGQLLLAQGDALKSIRSDIDSLRLEVKAGQKEVADTKTALNTEKAGRAKDNQEWEKKLAAANSQWERMFRTISWLAIVAIGISVTVGVLMHDFRISVAGGAGGMAVVVACMIVGQIQHWLPWVAGGLVAVVALWILIETLIRGSFKEAIRTSPIQDLTDALSGAGAGKNVTPVAGLTVGG